MAERLYNTPGDCRWLTETALRGYGPPPFKAFTLQGNEDCPLVITLYKSRTPLVADRPLAVYRLEQDSQSTLSLYVRE